MKKVLFLIMVLGLFISLQTTAWADPEEPSYGSACNSTYCHAAEELDPPFHKKYGQASISPMTVSTSPISLTLRNTIRFNNLYAMKVLKIERADSTQALLDLGDVSPSTTGTSTFWTKVYSNAPYTETFYWSDFSNGSGDTIDANRMIVDVTDNGVTDRVSNGGPSHPPGAGATHPVTNPVNWELVTVSVSTRWGDPAGGPWQNTLDIVVSQQ